MRRLAFVLVAFVAGCGGGGSTQVGTSSTPPSGGSDGGVGMPTPGGGGGGMPGGGGSGGSAGGGGGTGGSGGGGSAGVGGGGSGGGGGGSAGCDLSGPTAVWAHPVAIASHLVGDDANLYFLYGSGAVQARSLFTLAKDGSRFHDGGSLGWPFDVAVDTSTIYVMSRGYTPPSSFPVNGGVYYVDKASGAKSFVGAITGSCRTAVLSAITVVGGDLYWSQENVATAPGCTNPPVEPPSVDVVPPGGAPSRLVVETSAQYAHSILADDSHVFWADDAGVWRVARSGGMAELLSPATGAGRLATDGNSLFYAAADGVHAISAPLIDTLIYAGAVADIAADGQHVYASGDSGLVRLNGDGSGAQALVQQRTSMISLDDRYVYFVASDETIAKACK